MTLYEVQIKKGFNSEVVTKTVLAATIAKAIEFAQRYAKKNYYSNAEITSVEKTCGVDVFYKS